MLQVDLGTIEPSIAGPTRPQDRVELSQAAASFATALPTLLKPDAKVRRCRLCERDFFSDGCGNWTCFSCKKTKLYRYA